MKDNAVHGGGEISGACDPVSVNQGTDTGDKAVAGVGNLQGWVNVFLVQSHK
ncbi:hypothetical protein D3C80_1723450 [compost metagenome]